MFIEKSNIDTKKVLFCCSNNVFALKALQHIVNIGGGYDLQITHCLFSDVLTNASTELMNFCKEHFVNITDNPEDITKSVFKDDKFDLLISFSYQKKLHEDVINTAKLAVNFHPAPLPDYKGRAPAVWALINNENEFGATCHFIDAGIDTGKIIERRKFQIDKHKITTGRELSNFTWGVCLDELKDFLKKYLSGETITGTEQSNSGEYYSMAKLQSVKKIELTENNETINRKINALWYPPFEGAYIEVDGERFYLINKNILEKISEK